MTTVYNNRNSSFSFTAVGDYGQTSSTTANLNYIAGSGTSFNLALGDLNYDSATVSADDWSSYVRGHLPATFPFEIVVGEHDTAQIDALAADLPDRVGAISGTYAKEYFFDYPPGNPLARFIMVSPGGLVSGYQYTQGSPHYNWVASTIDNARAAHIPWVIADFLSQFSTQQVIESRKCSCERKAKDDACKSVVVGS